jgi:hypothetical protein
MPASPYHYNMKGSYLRYRGVGTYPGTGTKRLSVLGYLGTGI